MLTQEAVFRRIDADEVEPIQEFVRVDYDNALQTPISFQRRGRRYEVLELLGTFRESPHDPSLTYLVRTDDGVYALCLKFEGGSKIGHLRPIQWVLHFRVGEKEEAMLVDMKFKRVTDFHGHLCPDLAIGYRACRCALERLKFESLYSSEMQVIVENRTSALDAVQMLTGCTVGNHRLRIYDYGKHVYTFTYANKQGLRFALKTDVLSYSADFLELEQKVSAGMASLSETAQYWALLDRHVRALLNLSDEDLFNVRQVVTEPQPIYESSMIFRCQRCGELVAASRSVIIGQERICMPCAG